MLDQIRYPTNGSGMPANLVKGQEADDVAAYVALCAAATDKQACPESSTGTGRQGALRLARLPGLPLARRYEVDGPDVQGPLRLDREAHERPDASRPTSSTCSMSILDPGQGDRLGLPAGRDDAVIKKGQVSKDDAKTLVDFIKQQK